MEAGNRFLFVLVKTRWLKRPVAGSRTISTLLLN